MCLNLKEMIEGVKSSRSLIKESMMEETITMSISDKRKYFKRVSSRYQNSEKSRKGKILDEFCLIFEFSRNYAIRLLNQGYKRKRRTTVSAASAAS